MTSPGDPTDPTDPTDPDDPTELGELLARIPPGWTEVAYADGRWGLTRTDRAGGAATSLYAEQLGGTNVVSANVWRTSGATVLRPCEMPERVVLDFLRGWTRTEPGSPAG